MSITPVSLAAHSKERVKTWVKSQRKLTTLPGQISTEIYSTGLTIDDIDLFEVNEAFASVPLAWLKATGADPDRLNVRGGGISLGHPLGASGAKLMTSLVHALRARGKRYGLQTMCEGGGLANLTIVEAL